MNHLARPEETPMPTCPVEACTRPPHHNHPICTHHTWELERDLGDIPALVEELATTLARQTATGPRHGARSSEKPLPYDPAASEALYVLRTTLRGWAREVGTRDLHTVQAMALALLNRLDQLLAHPDAGDAVDEITTAVRECWRVIDRRDSRIYAGTCDVDGCAGALYARPGRANVTCQVCRADHDVEARRTAMRESVDGMLMTGAEIARLAAYFGEATDTQRSRNLIKLWANRGLIVAHGVNLRGDPTYPFGDTVARLLMAKARTA